MHCEDILVYMLILPTLVAYGFLIFPFAISTSADFRKELEKYLADREKILD
jgi:hypothetical protein